MTSRLIAAGLLVVLGCSDDPAPGDGDGDGDVEDYRDADWLFEPDRLLEVEIELPDAEWDALRFQSRNILDIFGDTCATAPVQSPFTYRPATVRVDGIELTDVGVRKKGFLGSLDETKPSLKLKFDEFVPGQKLTGTKRLTLNNAKQDPSLMNQCLGYDLFNRAGVPAPRCNFARVSVNGEPLGVYVNVESVKKPMLAMYFADNGGNLYEGTLSDFRDGWTATFERKTNEADLDRSDIDAVVAALALDDAAMAAELDRLIDLERFYSFWAIESMTSHWDGYSGNNNNFFVYGDPTSGKLTFLPWGVDQLFGNTGAQDPAATASALTRRLYLYEPTRTAYLERYAEILDQVWDDAALVAEIDRIDALVGSSVLDTAGYAAARDALRATLDGRESVLRDGLDAASPDDAEALSAPLCFAAVGSAQSGFATSYNAGATPGATFDLTIDGAARPLTDINAIAGPDNERPGRSLLLLTATDAAGKSAVLYIAIPDEQVGPGIVDVGMGRVEGVLIFIPPGAQEPDEIYFVDGPLDLAEAALTNGAPWSGSGDLRVWDTPFF